MADAGVAQPERQLFLHGEIGLYEHLFLNVLLETLLFGFFPKTECKPLQAKNFIQCYFAGFLKSVKAQCGLEHGCIIKLPVRNGYKLDFDSAAHLRLLSQVLLASADIPIAVLRESGELQLRSLSLDQGKVLDDSFASWLVGEHLEANGEVVETYDAYAFIWRRSLGEVVNFLSELDYPCSPNCEELKQHWVNQVLRSLRQADLQARLAPIAEQTFFFNSKGGKLYDRNYRELGGLTDMDSKILAKLIEGPQSESVLNDVEPAHLSENAHRQRLYELRGNLKDLTGLDDVLPKRKPGPGKKTIALNSRYLFLPL